MILMERVKEVRIKRANTDWWINEITPGGLSGSQAHTGNGHCDEVMVIEYDD